MINKDKIKEDLIIISNKILNEYNEPYEVDDIAIMNSSDNVTFLGNLRIFNEDNVKNIMKDLENSFKTKGKLTIRERKVILCCSVPYVHVSFSIAISN